MTDKNKTKEELLEEIERLRERIMDLEQAKETSEYLERLVRISEQAEREFSKRLSALLEIVNELSMEPTVDDLCRRAVELSTQRLGFERIGILFKTDNPEVFVGSFGIDEHGHIRDERNTYTHFDENSPEYPILNSKEPLVFWGTEPVVDAKGKVIGTGRRVLAPMWDGQKVIGHMSMDNLITNTPITEQQCNLFRMFSTSVGYLVTRKRTDLERERLITELQAALAQIKTLSGLIPICASCKKIRDDKGYWSQVEEYIRAHSDVEFTHSICPECMKKLYPEVVAAQQNDRQM
ncbi:MAG TPA: hypothetical protein PKY35_09820 [Candidatus Hydrogenedentes bacterium]|nr:hypothetical protein [Candidatus Hydrogenedentota bacterium]HOL77316.1 hypothetical protein [Candidatus Hydrogenedentota bacterium]HPO85958.1 hypothetical protein [Candidatus Hydrogenedentota bacterium]